MTRFLLFVLSLLIITPAFAQDGTCKPGVNCTVQTLRTTGGSSGRYSAQANSLYVTGTVSTPSTAAAYVYGSGTTASTLLVQRASGTAVNVTQDGVGQTAGVAATGTSWWGDGTNAGPGISFYADQDTGLYRIGANQLGVATAGARSFNFNATAGVVEGTSNATDLTMNTSTGARLRYIGSSVLLDSDKVTLTGANFGVAFAGAQQPTSFGVAVPRSLQFDTNSGRAYWQDVAPTAVFPARDFGAGPHPVLERRAYVIDPGYESTATPTWLYAAPRVAAGTASLTVVDAAAAGAASMGSSPGRVSFRSSVTLASAGSTSSLISSLAFVRDLGYAPRWCQKVGQFSAGTLRVFVGLTSALPGSAALPATHNVSFRFSSGDGDTKWQACYGAGSTTCVDTGVTPVSAPGSYDLLCIDCREGTAACTFWVNGVARLRQTTGLPTNSLAPFYSVEARSANAATLYAGPVSVEVN